MSMTAHKIYGPKGVGALFVKKGIRIEKIMDGGFQESNLRAGTENVPAIAGFGKAVEIFSDDDLSGVRKLRNYLYQELESRVGGVLLNGASDFERRIPNNLNVLDSTHQFANNIREEINERLEPLWDVKAVKVIFEDEIGQGEDRP